MGCERGMAWVWWCRCRNGVALVPAYFSNRQSDDDVEDRRYTVDMTDSTEALDWLIEDGHALLRELKILSLRPLKVDWSGLRLQPWQQSLLLEQLQFRQRAIGRFPQPEQWLWTDRSLQQASDWQSAVAKAGLFAPGSRVVDVCCGAGADLVALAAQHQVIGLDRDPAMLKLARHNIHAHDLSCEFVQADVASWFVSAPAPNDLCLHADPDRRRGAERDTRTIQAEAFSPPLSELMKLGQNARPASLNWLQPRRLANWQPTGVAFG